MQYIQMLLNYNIFMMFFVFEWMFCKLFLATAGGDGFFYCEISCLQVSFIKGTHQTFFGRTTLGHDEIV